MVIHNPKERRLRSLQRHILHVEANLNRLQQQSVRWSWARGISFLAAIGVSSLALFSVGAWLFWLCLLGLGALFVGCVVVHGRYEQSMARHALWRQIKLEQIARMKLDWSAMPPASYAAPDYAHPFEADLDLVGERSLHRLMDVAATAEGSARLRAWLNDIEPNRDRILQRQQLVREWRPLARLRTKLMLHGRLAAAAVTAQTRTGSPLETASATPPKWQTAQLLAWFTQDADGPALRRWLFVLGALAGVNALLFLLDWLAGAPPLWLYTFGVYVLLSLYAGTMAAHSGSEKDVFRQAAQLKEILARLTEVFRQIEKFSFRGAPHLAALCQPITQTEQRPSRYLRQLAWITSATGVRGNPFIGLALNAIAPWDIYFAWRLAQCKVDMAHHMPHWLEVWHELEALNGLANLGYLNPHYAFPTLLEKPHAKSNVLLNVAQMAHPLLPDVDAAPPKVRNDFTFDQLGKLVIITGSNMAGKSTFIKALGVNLALAFAGGPVDAAALQAVPFRIFTCIKVSDSVTNRISYFYAEVQRLKALLDALQAAHPLPLFFAIDEIFRGTNNRERLQGSQTYAQALTNQNGVGFISTHDLELVKLADDNPLIANVHFRDDVDGARMIFDYRLHPGPCPTTNALKIMQAAGLPISG
ncbi:MAG: hypothetical protein R2911_36025 [Caldilineaceae bacterium]